MYLCWTPYCAPTIYPPSLTTSVNEQGVFVKGCREGVVSNEEVCRELCVNAQVVFVKGVWRGGCN
jgi:hypothetical protein